MFGSDYFEMRKYSVSSAIAFFTLPTLPFIWSREPRNKKEGFNNIIIARSVNWDDTKALNSLFLV